MNILYKNLLWRFWTSYWTIKATSN